jgi:hypothetical protein
MEETPKMSESFEEVRPSEDFAEHRRTYDNVLRIALIGVLHVLSIVVGLAIGGVAHHWAIAGFWMIAATIAAMLGAAIQGLSWRPGAVILVVMLATLGTLTH